MTSPVQRRHRTVRRVAVLALAVGLFGASCNTAPLPPPSGSEPAPSTIGAPTPDSCPDLMLVPCQFQSAEVSIPLSGTDLSLHYSSTRAAGRKVAPFDPAATDIGGWTISVLSHLDVSNGIWLGGDGSRRRVTPIKAGDWLVVASASQGFADVFDASGEEIRRIDAFTGIDLDRFTYVDGHLASITDGNGVTTLERDATGQVDAIVGPLGSRTALSIDGSGALSSVLGASGRSDRFAYADGRLLSSWSDRNGSTTAYRYDADGLLVETDDRNGNTTKYSRTVTGGAVTVEADSVGQAPTTWQVEPSGSDWKWSLTLPSGVSTSEVVGPDSRSVTFADGTSADIALGPDPVFGTQAPVTTALRITTPAGRTLEAAETRAATSADPLSPAARDWTFTVGADRTQQHLDASSRTVVVTSPAGRATTATLGDFDRITALQRPGASPMAFTYDEQGRVAALAIGRGVDARSFTIKWDAAGDVAHVTDPSGATSTIAFDADGRAQVWQRADGQRVVLDRSDAGTPVGLSVNGQSILTIGANAAGDLTSYAPADGTGLDVTRLDYVAGRLKTVTQPDGTAASIRYDAKGSVAAVDAGNGEYSPTSSGSPSQTGWTDPGGQQELVTNDAGEPTQVAWTGPVQARIGITRDSVGRVAALAIGSDPPLPFTYDGDGLLQGAGDLSIGLDPATGLASSAKAGVVSTALGYDSLGERTSLAASGPAGQLFSENLARDNLGRVVSDTTTIQGATSTSTFAYDSAGRLAASTIDGHRSTYAYDARDNLVAVSGGTPGVLSVNARNELVTAGSRTFTWTAAGTLRTQRASDGSTTAYHFDGLGQLTRVDLSNGGHVDYLIDAEGRLLGRLVAGKLVDGYLYLPGDDAPVAEVDATGSVVAAFVYAGPGAPALMRKGGHTYRIVSDHLGSPRLVIDTATGEVVEQIDYDALGRVVRDTDPGFQPFGFTGGLRDPDTGLVRLGVRDYDPSVGRWISPDPSLLAGGPNRYEYAGDDWINLVDRDGRQPEGEESGLGPIITAEGLVSGTAGVIAGTAGLSEEVATTPLAEVAWNADVRLVTALTPAAEAAGKFLPGVGIGLGVADSAAAITSIVTEGAKPGNVADLAAGLGGIAVNIGFLLGGPTNPVGGGLIALGLGLYAGALVGKAVALGTGDPHFVSFDGTFFDFQGAGEFVLARDPGGGLEVQVRLEPRGPSRIVSVITAVAIDLGEGHRVGIYRGARHELVVDGQPIDLPAGSVEVGAVGSVTALPNGHYLVTSANGKVAIEISPRGGASIGIKLGVDTALGRGMVGLAGSADGNPANDFSERDGTVVANPDFDAIHRQFGESWRITASESLFDYAPGKSTASYTDRSFPDHEASVADVPAPARAAATAVCRGAGISDPTVLNACILDVGLLKDASLAGGLADENATAVALQARYTSRSITLPADVSASLVDPAARDRYTLALNAGDTIFAEAITPCDANNGVRWSLADAAGAPVGPLPDTQVCSSLGRITVEQQGTYTITVSVAGTSAVTPVTYGFRVLSVPPDQSFQIGIGQAVSQNVPGTGAGSIESPGAVDRYALTVAAAPTAVYLQSQPSCSNDELRWNIRDPSGALVNDNEIARLCEDIGRLELEASGTYTITVSGLQFSDATGTYGFAILAVPADQSFAINVGDTVSAGVPGPGAGSIETPGAVDRYTFTASAGQAVGLTAAQPCSSNELRWNVRDASGAILNADEIERVCTDIGKVVLAVSGTYTITVFAIQGSPATGTYGFSLKPA